MSAIIPKVERESLDKELTQDKLLTDTNNGGNQIYVFNAHNAPMLMREVGRLREITFRSEGGGTGKEMDIDEYDTADTPFQQLIVWNPDEKEIVGGYRFIHGRDIAMRDGQYQSPTARLFQFSDAFVQDYLPESIELGRSFVQPSYQPTYNLKKGLYSLDNLWDGLGAMIVETPGVRYLFGKMTMYTSFNTAARDVLLHFMKSYFPDKVGLLSPKSPLVLSTPEADLKALFTGASFEDNYKILIRNIRNHKENIPALFNAYMNLSPTMMTFGTSVNEHFGAVEETAMMITVADVYSKKKERYVQSYISKLSKNLKSIRKYRYAR